ncbi:MBL fold metallo-hydrolase [candidate division KSB1 bacterium]|nr:MBL fold metallo-hydrolase [candidate division KSB1 bacterium]
MRVLNCGTSFYGDVLKSCEEIAEGIFIIRTPLDENCHVASYLLVSRKQAVIIDTGLEKSGAQLCALVQKLGIAVNDVQAIINTHSHHDHIGSNAELKHVFQCPVIAHKFAVAWIENHQQQFDEFLGHYEDICPVPAKVEQSFFENLGQESTVDQVFDQLFLYRVGDRQINLVPTAGHSKDSIVVLDTSTSTVISGDSLMGRGVAGALPQYDDLAAYRDTLVRVAHLCPEKLFSSHFSPHYGNDVEAFINDSFQMTLYIEKVVADILLRQTEYSLLQLAREVCAAMNAGFNIQTLYTIEAHVNEKEYWRLK